MSTTASDLVDTAAPPAPRATPRVVGVDVARGAALLGMFAVHIFDTLHADYHPSKTFVVMGGHALATFVLLAGVSITFTTKRSRTGPLLPDAAALVTRAALITLIGLALNTLLDPGIDVILPYYGLMFLLAIPLLRRRSRTLVGIAAVLALVAPLLVLATFPTDLPDSEPGLSTLAHPVALLSPLLVTGSYPVVAYLAFICIGMVIGRLDLSDRRVALRLFGGGAALAAAAWFAATFALVHLGGLDHLRAAAPSDVGPRAARSIILWDPDTVSSWWWLLQRAPYTTTTFRILHDIGIATGALGAALLVTRSRTGARVVAPLAAAGAMTLTLYTAHVVVLSSPFLEDHLITLYAVLVYVALSFAALWRQSGRRGPLEAGVAWSSTQARRLAEATAERGRARRGRHHVG